MTRPRVLVNCAVSVDGKLNPAPALRHGDFQMSRHDDDPRRMKQLRARADAIVIGAANLRADDPDLALAAAERDARRARGQPEPLRVVVTRAGEGVGPSAKMFDTSLGGSSVVVHAHPLDDNLHAAVARVATVVKLGEDWVDIRALLGWLGARGVSTVLCEGGGEINAAFFAARAVDELFVVVCPRLLGGVKAPTLVAGQGFAPDAIPDATLGSLERVGDELFLRYDFRW